MRYIGYDELAPERNYPKIKDSLESGEYPHKAEIIQFLLNGEIDLARVSRARDVFTDEIIPTEVLVMHSGDYCWSNTLAWYVEKYNLRLPKDFENYILSNV